MHQEGPELELDSNWNLEPMIWLLLTAQFRSKEEETKGTWHALQHRRAQGALRPTKTGSVSPTKISAGESNQWARETLWGAFQRAAAHVLLLLLDPPASITLTMLCSSAVKSVLHQQDDL